MDHHPAPLLDTGISALLGPTNTGKTQRAIERMLQHRNGMIGLPLRLLAREVYDRITAKLGERRVALLTGEEKRVPARPDYWVCTVESMPTTLDVDFLCIDEIQLAAHPQRGHTFTERFLHARGLRETWLLGSGTMRPLVEELLPTARVQTHPRFSELRHAGSHTLGSLPPRTAVVAFSVDDVYELAERIRQRHGGTAVVLGALSPRTRNAQVAMYEAGEVQYMVATDAIGMGLNLDLDRVVFASLQKFDGRQLRSLAVEELAQIAGRAGRYTRDGRFGTLKPLPELAPPLASAIEHHAFDPVRHLVWRNADLDFSSIDNLIESLRQRPRRNCLTLIHHADDFAALTELSRREDIRRRARGPIEVERLWDVCRIPDFRKLVLDSHVQLLDTIFQQLTNEGSQIDVDWMARRIEPLDDVSGGIDALMNRMAFIRTWTYITHHESWVPNAAHWQDVVRQIEDRQSDALHQRLTERFVDGRAARTQRSRRRARPAPAEDPVERRGHNPFAQLASLDLPSGTEVVSVSTDVDTWVNALVEAHHNGFGVDASGSIRFRGDPVARLKRGNDILHPDVELLGASELGAGAQGRIVRRLVAWCRDAVSELLEPIRRIPERDLSGPARGLAYQLERGLGTVDRRDADQQFRDLEARDRRCFTRAGIRLGRVAAFLPGAVTQDAVALRIALWSAFVGRANTWPEPTDCTLDIDPQIGRDYYRHIGFLPRASKAIRVDALDDLEHRASDLARNGPFELAALDAAAIRCTWTELAAIVRTLGFRERDDGRWERSTRPRRPPED